ncbi:hypothetical protein [Candidatus Protochlamydia phocaeensis]|uniref:hypothetical protein n=1 Tax=Candidatus Protochlamydia phocaeensis TaxID=1414722 RepID=UPI0008393C05|nr:hypothetical protein [Candidatus Protochlamydia phocaeensis]
MSYSVNSAFPPDSNAYDFPNPNAASPAKYLGYPSQYDYLIDDTKPQDSHRLNEFCTVSASNPTPNIDSLKHKVIVQHESDMHANRDKMPPPTSATFTSANPPSKTVALANRTDKSAKPSMMVHPSSLHSFKAILPAPHGLSKSLEGKK